MQSGNARLALRRDLDVTSCTGTETFCRTLATFFVASLSFSQKRVDQTTRCHAVSKASNTKFRKIDTRFKTSHQSILFMLYIPCDPVNNTDHKRRRRVFVRVHFFLIKALIKAYKR